MHPNPVCNTCGEELDHLDKILNKRTGSIYNLWICHNEECESYGSIWNDQQPGFLNPGDPSGLY